MHEQKATTTMNHPDHLVEKLVLVVDDDKPTAHFLSRMIEKKGFKVVSEQDPNRAVLLARMLKPCLLTLDISMPHVNGLELLEVLRNDPETMHIPVIIISAMDAARGAVSKGAFAFIKKPVKPVKLYETVDSALAAHRPGNSANILVTGRRSFYRHVVRALSPLTGFEFVSAANIEKMLEIIDSTRIGAVLIDAASPSFDLIEAIGKIRSGGTTAALPIMAVGNRMSPEERVQAIETGCDDVMKAPVFPSELNARLKRLIERTHALLQVNPSSGLPGSPAIEKEIAKRSAAGEPFVFCYMDVDNFKVYNDVYGFAKADGALKHLAGLLAVLSAKHNVFVGHIGGDDFIAIAGLADIDDFAHDVTTSFDRLMRLHYDEFDLNAGYIKAVDRYGTLRRFPLMSLSLAAIIVEEPLSAGIVDLATSAAELKHKVKSLSGSNIMFSKLKSPVQSKNEKPGDQGLKGGLHEDA
ncbi:MAG: response regulator [Deltaproteobacteria bacterium]|nr:response regulator [Deltaproteobacteria bacterium]